MMVLIGGVEEWATIQGEPALWVTVFHYIGWPSHQKRMTRKTREVLTW
jgi:hypothetical protein